VRKEIWIQESHLVAMTVRPNYDVHTQPITLDVPIGYNEPLGRTLEVVDLLALASEPFRLPKNP
jgi:hypothetical protein